MTSTNLLIFLSYLSQIYINLALEISCTTKPTSTPTTAEPTLMMMSSPTKAPIITPGVSEANPPTLPPTPIDIVSIGACSTPRTDTVVINDVSCPMTVDQCEYQQQQLATVLNSFKDVDKHGSNTPYSRVSYIEFDSTNISTIIPLDHSTYNTLPVSKEDMEAFNTVITNAGMCDDAPQRTAYPNLMDAITTALDQFASAGSDNRKQDKKILIFSHCKADNIEEICEDTYIQESMLNAVNIVMINVGDGFEDDSYILCLAEYDPTRIFNFDLWIDEENLKDIQFEMCSSPTPVPTTDPTMDPTVHPIKKEEPRRRSLERETEYDITSGFNGSPCIEMNIKLETENLLPLNSDPDPVSNIMVIAAAIANQTLGKVTIPQSYDPEENDTIPDPNVVWVIDSSCDDGVMQMDRTYMLPYKLSYSLDLVIEDRGTDGFLITSDLQTNASSMYMTHVESLPLSLSHDCSDDVVVGGAIYHNNTLVSATEHLTISTGDSEHTFEFTSTVKLYPDTLYQIRFELIGGYPDDCSYSDIEFGDSSRRRLDNFEDVDADAVANACLLGKQLAKSEAMQAGANTMCSDTLGETVQLEIEEGLFRQHISQSAINNHLLKTGSLYLFDSDGLETFSTTDFPRYNVEKPCIAVDEDNRMIFAIGGHINGTATDLIQVYQFTNASLHNGTVLDVGNWTLDRPRYGSMCFYWNDNGDHKIIVLSGMATEEEEFTNRNAWYQDVRSFTVPEFIYDQRKLSEVLGGYVPPSLPREGSYSIQMNLIDSKLLLVENHELWLFGGKTHLMSKKFVSKFSLDDIADTATDNILVEVQSIKLATHKALALADTVSYNGECCYMIFNGQQYKKYEPVDMNDTLQLYCNENIEGCDDRRRLSEFDVEMMRESKRRRLQTEDEMESEIVISSYYLNELDGVWYDFSVNFELCYADNTKLLKAESEYREIIDGKESDSAEWVQYKEDIGEVILNVSMKAYKGWSIGFGAVNVFGLSIIDVRYCDTPAQSTKERLSHPERRKARFWGSNYEERNQDFIWIDEKFINSDWNDEGIDDSSDERK